jgi:hypothetical protein
MALKKPLPTVTPPQARRASVADFRTAIAEAESGGVKKDKMVLRLTLRDDSDLKRSRDVATNEISFANGGMRFLGVTVVTGGVTHSVLDTSGT